MSSAGVGRPRDASIDERVLAVAASHLACSGYEAMSVSAVAEEAGTTRQAVYRRWTTKADLATAAIASLAREDRTEPTDDPFADLVAELESFRRGVTRPDGLSMVGTMLVESTDPELVARYRDRVVRPRRTAIRRILERGRDAGLLHPDADLDVAVVSVTGGWYARALAGQRPLAGWATRTAAFIWRGLGGTVPQRPSAAGARVQRRPSPAETRSAPTTR